MCASVVSYVVRVLFLLVLHVRLFWCPKRAVLRDCGISLVVSLIFFPHNCDKGYFTASRINFIAMNILVT